MSPSTFWRSRYATNTRCCFEKDATFRGTAKLGEQLHERADGQPPRSKAGWAFQVSFCSGSSFPAPFRRLSECFSHAASHAISGDRRRACGTSVPQEENPGSCPPAWAFEPCACLILFREAPLPFQERVPTGQRLLLGSRVAPVPERKIKWGAPKERPISLVNDSYTKSVGRNP